MRTELFGIRLRELVTLVAAVAGLGLVVYLLFSITGCV